MNLQPSSKSVNLQRTLADFMENEIYPNESEYYNVLHNLPDRFGAHPVIEDLKRKAKERGLWNLFIPPEFKEHSLVGGLSNIDYQPLAELMGRAPWSPEVFNCNAPDAGNMEVLMRYGTQSQRDEWLVPLLEGSIRSSYAMTEPAVGSSDATNVETSIKRKGDSWLINGRKWFITGAMNSRTKLLIVMGKSDADNEDRYKQQTQVLVPRNTPGVSVLRSLKTLGYDDAPLGHAEVNFENVEVPLDNVLLGEGRGFDIAQGRLGPGRMHHCMRLIGAAQRSFELACTRASTRITFGRPIGSHQSVRESLSKSYSEIEMARLLVMKTAKLMDSTGAQENRDMIASTKSTVPLMVQRIIDRCMQLHGAGGLSQDFPMAEAFNYARWCRQADGPDEVHQMALGKILIDKYGQKESNNKYE